MSQIEVNLPQIPELGRTSRKDRWWVQPLAVFLGLSAFIVYSTWAAWQNEHFYAPTLAESPANLTVPIGGGLPSEAHYLSPMYSPVLWNPPVDAERTAYRQTGHAWFGNWPDWLPAAIWFIPITPAFLILWAPGGFRFTCYYYRGAYYKAFWLDPPTCAVGEPGFRKKKYRGEHSFPLILQNVHRYFLYVAILFIGILSYDAIISYTFTGANAEGERVTTFGIAMGSIVLTINPILLGAYTFGCHSLRHLVGGRFNRLSDQPGRKKAYDCVSCLNRRHMLWAWLSLFWVGFTDFYVRMVSMGYITDYRFI